MNQSQNELRTLVPTDDRPQFVPPSLLKIRRFLFQYGMPIVPWTSAEYVLDEFYAMLEMHKEDSAFWQDISKLLTDLQRDLQERLAGNAQDNEVLPLVTRGELLDEMRTRLLASQTHSGGFLAYLRELTPYAASVLMLLGAAMTVSCGGETDLGTGIAAAQGGSASAGGSSNGGSSNGGIAQTGGTKANGSGGQNSATGGSSSCSQESIESIIARCNYSSTSLNSCVATLNASWRQGLQALLSCQDCASIQWYINCLQMRCASLPAQYLESLISNCAVTVYSGVRLEL